MAAENAVHHGRGRHQRQSFNEAAAHGRGKLNEWPKNVGG